MGILNFRENTDDGFLKVTLAIGTVDQNLKLQQGINERLMGNLMQQQMPQQIQNQNYNTFPTQNINNQQPTTQIQAQDQENNLQNEAIMTLNPKLNTEKKENKESEREPEFSKYVKQLKVLH